jgi:hypothetical protein
MAGLISAPVAARKIMPPGQVVQGVQALKDLVEGDVAGGWDRFVGAEGGAVVERSAATRRCRLAEGERMGLRSWRGSVGAGRLRKRRAR